MSALGYVRRVPLAVSGALRRFAQDPARGRAALERAVPGLGPDTSEDPLTRVDRAVARDRYADACRALEEVPENAPERGSAALAVEVLAGRLTSAARAHPRDARGRRAVRAAQRQLALLGQPMASR